MTRDQLHYARVQWLTSAVRGLLRAHYKSEAAFDQSSAGQVDAELRSEEDKFLESDLSLGPLAFRFLRKKAQQVIEDFLKEHL